MRLSFVNFDLGGGVSQVVEIFFCRVVYIKILMQVKTVDKNNARCSRTERGRKIKINH